MGTTEGGKSAAEENIRKYGPDFYKVIGKLGGQVSHPETRYFQRGSEAARLAGAAGGRKSKRTKKEDV